MKSSQFGSTGEEVTMLQLNLKRLGYDIVIDGIFGPRTEETVKLFQKENHLTIDGIVGDITNNLLLHKVNQINIKKNITEIWDKMTEEKINKLHPKIKNDVKLFIVNMDREHDIKLRITSGFRSIQEQDILYSYGRTRPGDIITYLSGGNSYHNYGLAFDVVEIKDNDALWENENWDKIGRIGKLFDFKWGGDFAQFKDRPHFHKSYNYNTKSLKGLVDNGKIDDDGYVII